MKTPSILALMLSLGLSWSTGGCQSNRHNGERTKAAQVSKGKSKKSVDLAAQKKPADDEIEDLDFSMSNEGDVDDDVHSMGEDSRFTGAFQ